MICVFFAVWPLFAISKPVVSATHPPLRSRLPAVSSERVCKYRIFLGKYKELRSKFIYLPQISGLALKLFRRIIYGVPLCRGIFCCAVRSCAGLERIIEKLKQHETDFSSFAGPRCRLHPGRQDAEMQLSRNGYGFPHRMPGRHPGCARMGPERRRVARRRTSDSLPTG